MDASSTSQDQQYLEAVDAYGPAFERLARAYEADPDKRRDLLQDIHVALWRSFASFDGRCSVRTWVYRVAHNAAATHVIRERRRNSRLVSIEDIEVLPDRGGEGEAGRRHALEKLLALIQQLKPLDRQVILSYLEGLDGAAIAEITGISPGNAATKIHRIKNLLARQFQPGDRNA